MEGIANERVLRCYQKFLTSFWFSVRLSLLYDELPVGVTGRGVLCRIDSVSRVVCCLLVGSIVYVLRAPTISNY
jgi:hypothetical protein